MTTDEQAISAADRIAAEVRKAVMSGDWQRAYETSNRAISRGIRHPVFFTTRARRMEQAGKLQFALEDYERAVEIAPGDPGVHDAAGICAMKLQKIERAAEAFEAARRLDPSAPGFHFRCGLAYAHLGESDAAEAAYRDALNAEPDFADALANLAAIKARQGNVAEARTLAEKALAVDPRHTTAAVALIRADMAEHRYADAEQRITALFDADILPPDGRATILGLLGDVLDGQKRYAEAFAAYEQENEQLRRIHAGRFSANLGAEALRSLIGYFENAPAPRWRAPDDGRNPPMPASGHVFLLGFMRSGTTLLEQVLAANPAIVAFEEEGLFGEMGDKYMTSVPALDLLADLKGDALENERRLYWQRVTKLCPDCAGKIVVDKQPLNTLKLPLIAKLFPNAKILFAIRDPRDVVFSCYRRRFKIDAALYSFLTLEDTARFYASTMRLAEIFREKLQLQILDHRYEAMVEDFEGRVRAVCDFIGLEWTDTMRAFDKQESVADLRSPSASQVRRPLYSEGVAQWRRYADQLAPIYPIVAPWVEKFGYPKV